MASSRRWRLTAATLAVLALTLSACGGGEEEAAPEAPATEAPAEEPAEGSWCTDTDVTPSITVGVNNPNYATQLAVRIAIERGYLAEEGITDVEVIETDEYIAGLLGGSLFLAQGDTDVTFGAAEASGEDLRYLGTYRFGEYQIMGVSAEIEEASDLVGKPVTGGDIEGRNTTLMKKYLTNLGVDPESVEFVEVGGNSDARLQALIAGQVAAASLFPRHKVPLEEAGGYFITEDFVANPQEGLIIMGETLESDCATVIAYMKADLRARQDMYDYSQKDDILALMRGLDFEIPDYFEDVYQLEVEQVGPDGGFDPALMDSLVAEIIAIGDLPEGLDWRQYVDLRALHSAQEALGLPLNPASLD